MKRSKTQMLRNLAVAMLLGAGLVSCSQDDFADKQQGEPLPPGEYPLELTAGGLEAIATPAQQSAPSTRGTVDGDWTGTEGKTVAVQVLDQAGQEISTNEYYIKGISNENKTATLASDNPYYWQSSNEEITVNALYPRTTMPSNKEPFNLPEVCTAETLRDYDFLWATENIKFGEQANLEFRHLMAKFVINLRNSDYLKAAENEGKEIKAGFEMYLDGMFYINGSTCSIGIPDYVHAVDHTVCSTGANENVNFGNGITEDAFASYTTLAIPTTQVIGVWVLVGETKYLYETEGFTSYSAGHTYTFNITVKESGLQVNANENIGWGDDGAEGSGSVELPDYVIVPGEGQQGKELVLKDGEVVDINGDGKPVKDQFSFTIPEGATAIVNLNNVHIQSYADYQSGIVIDGGGTVILKLNGTENTIENFVYGINNSGGEGSHICIEGPGTLKMKNLSVRPLTTTKSIKITSATLQFDYTSNSKYYVSACIGSAYNQTCGDITIIKSDIHINVKCPSKWYEKFGAAIGCGGGNEAGTEGGVCGNIDITLPEGISIEEFLGNINVLKEDGSALLNNDQKVGKGLYGKSCGTVTWRRSDGTILETIPAH